MDLQLINQELSEARLYRYSHGFTKMDARQLANLLYLYTLAVYMLSRDEDNGQIGIDYAKLTTQYGPYALFRTHATDLYMLAYQIAHPDNRHTDVDGKELFNKMMFNNRLHWRFIKDIADGTVVEPSLYFFRLETQLKISDSRYREWRRLLSDWGNLKYPQRQLVVAKILQELRKLGRASELIGPLTGLVRDRDLKLAARSYPDSRSYVAPDTKPSLTKGIAGAALGAYAARKLAPKVAQYAQDNPQGFKRAATGIGAIAGYWAGRRKK
jgi:hypothetical protein